MLLEPQRDDVRIMLDAQRRGDRAFLLGNSTGTGKTFESLALLKEVSPARALIVVPNKGIAKQWRDEARRFGLNVQEGVPNSSDQGIWISTYAGLRSKRHAAGVGELDIAIFDEVHREGMKTAEFSGARKTAEMVRRVAGDSQFAVYSTATPFETPYHLHYLDALGLWSGGETGFKKWTEAHGVVWRERTVRTPYGEKKIEQPAFRGSPEGLGGRVRDMLDIHAKLISQGRALFKEIQLDVPLKGMFRSSPTESGEHGATIKKATDALDAAFGEVRGDPLMKAQYVGHVKRLADYAKIDAGVDAAAEAVHAGHSAAVFISNKAGYSFQQYINKAHAYEDWLRDKMAARGFGGDAGPPPCSRVVAALGRVYEDTGFDGTPDLPGPIALLTDKLRKRLGPDQVAEYTGDVSAAKRNRVKDAFQRGEIPVIVATIAAGGTGLSLHDTKGDRPREQINLGLPWTGRDLSQLIGRTYRVGTKSPVTQRMFLTEHPEEQRIAGVVAARMEQLRAGVSGITADRNVARLREFEYLNRLSDGDEETAAELAKALVGAGLGYRPPVVVWIKSQRKDVRNPGSRGGRFYIDSNGKVRYGVPPDRALATQFSGVTSRQQIAERRKESGFYAGRKIAGPRDVADIFRSITDADREKLYLLHIDGKNQPRNVELISQGTLTQSYGHPREVLKNAAALGTRKIALIHNHPAEDPYPSPEDVRMTGVVKAMTEMLGIQFVTHVVVAEKGYSEVTPDFPATKESWAEHTVADRQLSAIEGRIGRVGPGLLQEHLDKRIRSAEDVAEIGRMLLDPGDQLAVALVLDNKSNVRGVFPLVHGEEFDPAVTAQHLAALSVRAGAAQVIITGGVDGPKWASRLRQLHDLLVGGGNLTVMTDTSQRNPPQSLTGVGLTDTVLVGESGWSRSVREGTL